MKGPLKPPGSSFSRVDTLGGPRSYRERQIKTRAGAKRSTEASTVRPSVGLCRITRRVSAVSKRKKDSKPGNAESIVDGCKLYWNTKDAKTGKLPEVLLETVGP